MLWGHAVCSCRVNSLLGTPYHGILPFAVLQQMPLHHLDSHPTIRRQCILCKHSLLTESAPPTAAALLFDQVLHVQIGGIAASPPVISTGWLRLTCKCAVAGTGSMQSTALLNDRGVLHCRCHWQW